MNTEASVISPVPQVTNPVVPQIRGRTERIPSLDGVRGFAIILVILWHYLGMQLTHQSAIVNFFREVFGICWSGVDLFFVLSGFLLGGILMDNRDSPRYFQTFYIRRACRIFPLYYAWLVVVICSFHLFEGGRFSPLFVNFNSPWPFLTYTQNITEALFQQTDGGYGLQVTWSLAVEEQFYLILPLMIYFVPRKNVPGLLLLFIFSSTLFRLASWYWGPHQGWAGYVLLPCRWDSLFTGVMGAWLIRQPVFVRWLSDNRWFVWGLMLMIGLVITILRIEKQGNLAYYGMHAMGFLLLAVFYLGLILLVVSDKNGWLARLFSMRWLCALGIISYGVYIFHLPVLALLQLLTGKTSLTISSWHDFGITLAALCLTVSLAALSWSVFESKIVKWGRRHSY